MKRIEHRFDGLYGFPRIVFIDARLLSQQKKIRFIRFIRVPSLKRIELRFDGFYGFPRIVFIDADYYPSKIIRIIRFIRAIRNIRVLLYLQKGWPADFRRLF
ncbi:MAG TPA: hypothetical protein VK957_01920 [Lunatimonas sp.]|nr:hypothetical protein [Lunatimonas sp.]